MLAGDDQRHDHPEDADNHQDVADHHEIDAADPILHGEGKDGADREQDEGSTDVQDFTVS